MALARLCHEFGQDEDYWLFGPHARLNAALELLRKKDEAEERAIAKAAGRGAPRDPSSHAVQSFRAWQKAEAAFLAKFPPLENPPAAVPTVGASDPQQVAKQEEQSVDRQDEEGDRKGAEGDDRKQQDDQERHGLTS
jgi:hypothetical protein